MDRFGIRTKVLLLALPAVAGAVACAPASAATAHSALSSTGTVEWSGAPAGLMLDDNAGTLGSNPDAQGNPGSDHKGATGQPDSTEQTPSTSGSSDSSSPDSPSSSDPGSPGAEPDDIPSDGQDLLTAPGAPVPALGREVAVAPASGTVLVQSGGHGRFTPLQHAADLPVGSVVDATKGTMVLASAVDAAGTKQFAAFRGASFSVRQAPKGQGMTDIVLVDSSSSCRGSHRRAGKASAAARRGARVVHSLWATDNHGRFRTRGNSSVAAVRGTTWVTTDRCDGTLTSVSSGQVAVWDLKRKRTVVVSAGHSYLARA